MFWIALYEILNVPKPVRQRLHVGCPNGPKAKTSAPKCFHLLPLLQIVFLWRFKRSTHFMGGTATLGTFCLAVMSRLSFPRLTASETGVSNQVLLLRPVFTFGGLLLFA